VSETVRLSCATEPFEGGIFSYGGTREGFRGRALAAAAGAVLGFRALMWTQGGSYFPCSWTCSVARKNYVFFFLFGLIICVFPLAASGLELLMWSQGAGDFTLLLCAVLPPKL
jgi:hypothetical protein